MAKPTDQFVYILTKHDQGGDVICGVFGTRQLAVDEWKKKSSYRTDVMFGVGHTVKRHVVRWPGASASE